MCILLNVKKHEKTFALNVDIFTIKKNLKKVLTYVSLSGIVRKSRETRQKHTTSKKGS